MEFKNLYVRGGWNKIAAAVLSCTHEVCVQGTVMLAKLPPSDVEEVAAPATIERALLVYQQLKERDSSVLSQARKLATQHIYGMVDRGECNEQRLTVAGLVRLKAVERDRCAPEDFYSTTNHQTSVRLAGQWVKVERQRMDAGPRSSTNHCR